MRILIHTDEYYPTAQACSYRMRTMADAFIDQGDEVVVIASSTNKGNGKIEPRREKILYSPAIRMKKKTTVMRMLNNLSFGFTSIFTALKAGKVDVVITTSLLRWLVFPDGLLLSAKVQSLFMMCVISGRMSHLRWEALQKAVFTARCSEQSHALCTSILIG